MVMYGYGNILSIKEKQVKFTENVIYSTSTSSTKEEEDFKALLVMDEYTSACFKHFKIGFYFKYPLLSCSQG
jgi:hypothetical protein